MKNIVLKFGSLMAGFALVMTGLSANQACMFWIHQPEMPEAAKRLRKF